MAEEQGGPPPTLAQCEQWAREAGHELLPAFARLLGCCHDAGFDLELQTPYKPRRPDPPGPVALSARHLMLRLLIFAPDRGYVFCELARSIAELELIAEQASERLRRMGLMT